MHNFQKYTCILIDYYRIILRKLTKNYKIAFSKIHFLHCHFDHGEAWNLKNRRIVFFQNNFMSYPSLFSSSYDHLRNIKNIILENNKSFN